MSANQPSGELIDTRPLVPMLTTLLAELTDGPSPEAAHVLNRGDIGLLRSLAASRVQKGPGLQPATVKNARHFRA